eukprot:1161625-Pelagomonas_calceolata.AAC.5
MLQSKCCLNINCWSPVQFAQSACDDSCFACIPLQATPANACVADAAMCKVAYPAPLRKGGLLCDPREWTHGGHWRIPGTPGAQMCAAH